MKVVFLFFYFGYLVVNVRPFLGVLPDFTNPGQAAKCGLLCAAHQVASKGTKTKGNSTFPG